MAIAKDADCSQFRFFTASTSMDAALSITVASNALIAVGYALDTYSGAVTCTASDGNGYTEVIGKSFATANQARTGIFLYENGSGAKSITLTPSTATYGRCFASSFTGLGAYNGTNDPPISATGNSTAPATGSSGTLSNANSLVLAVFGGTSTAFTGATIPPNSGYTTLYSNLTNANVPFVFAYKIVSATTAVSANLGTLSAGDNWGTVLAIITQASATGKCPIILLGA